MTGIPTNAQPDYLSLDGLGAYDKTTINYLDAIPWDLEVEHLGTFTGKEIPKICQTEVNLIGKLPALSNFM